MAIGLCKKAEQSMLDQLSQLVMGLWVPGLG